MQNNIDILTCQYRDLPDINYNHLSAFVFAVKNSELNLFENLLKITEVASLAT